jgi:hypothetical protein
LQWLCARKAFDIVATGKLQGRTIKMSIRKSFLIICLVGLMPAITQAQSQNPLEKFQEKVEDALPKGRFLKRLRDEVTGSKSGENKKAENQKSARQGNASANRIPTPANRPNQSVLNPPPASDPQSGLRRQPSSNSNRLSTEPAVPPKSNWLQPNNQSAPPRNLAFYQGPDRSKPKSSGAPKTGFGMQLEERDDRLVVTNVHDHGNASAIGLRRGDRIVKIGGVAVSNQKDFDEIAGVLGAGDQIQIVYDRRGDEKEENLQFGEAPSVDEFTDERPIEKFQFSSRAPGQVPDFAPPIRTGDDDPAGHNDPAAHDDPELMPPGNFNDGSALVPGTAPNKQIAINANRLPRPNNNPVAPSTEQLMNTIQQQQQVIRELQQQVQQLQGQQQQKKNPSRFDR